MAKHDDTRGCERHGVECLVGGQFIGVFMYFAICTPFIWPYGLYSGIFDIDYSTAKADKGRIEWNGPNGDCCIKTTLARQIANWVIIYSPLQMAADLIENYEGHPAFQFFRDFDADCDWSRGSVWRNWAIYCSCTPGWG